MGEDMKDLSVASFIRTLILFYKNTNPIQEGSSLMTYHLQKLLLPNTFTLGIKISMYEFGGGKHSDHSIHHLGDCSVFQVRNTPGLNRQKIGKLFGGWNKQSLIKKIVGLNWNASKGYLLHIKRAIDLRRLFKV